MTAVCILVLPSDRCCRHCCCCLCCSSTSLPSQYQSPSSKLNPKPAFVAIEVYAVNDVPEAFASWCEGCRCHQAWCKHRQRQQRAAIMETHYGRHTTTCPLAGKNSSQLAAGAHKSFLCSLQADVTVHLMGSYYAGLTEQQRELLHKDLMVAVDHISWVIETKLQLGRFHACSVV